MIKEFEEYIEQVQKNYDSIWDKAFEVGFRMGREEKCLTCPYRDVGESENVEN